MARVGPRRRFGWRAVLAACAAAVLGVVAWMALAPFDAGTHDATFEIPQGTWARRMAGNAVEILPDTIRLTLGARDVLHLRNLDEVPQVFGPVLIMPGQSFRLPFERASTYSFACTAHASGQMTVVVDPAPAPGWQALRWRAQAVTQVVTQAVTQSGWWRQG